MQEVRTNYASFAKNVQTTSSVRARITYLGVDTNSTRGWYAPQTE